MLTIPAKITVIRNATLPRLPKVTDVRFENDKIIFLLTNGGELAFRLDEFPRLHNAAPEHRERWRLVWDGEAIRWDDIDEDISIRRLLTGEC